MMDRKKTLCFMMEPCCKDMSEEHMLRMKDMCKGLAGQFSSCRQKMDFSSFMESYLSRPAAERPWRIT